MFMLIKHTVHRGSERPQLGQPDGYDMVISNKYYTVADVLTEVYAAVVLGELMVFAQ